MALRKPAVLAKRNRRKEHFASKVMVGKPSAGLPEAQMKHPPIPVVVLNQIAMANPLKLITALIAVGQHGIARIGFERAGD
ncbi:hypothetical protein D3C85_1664340 [compost metagenome]